MVDITMFTVAAISETATGGCNRLAQVWSDGRKLIFFKQKPFNK